MLQADTPQHPCPALLAGRQCRLDGEGLATEYARALLRSLGAEIVIGAGRPDRHPARAWAESGLMALTGQAAGAPLMGPAPLASCADGVLAAFAALLEAPLAEPLPDARLLSERAALAGLARRGAISPGGGCRLLATADGWLALSLSRDEDWRLLPAWLECDVDPAWESLAPLLAQRATTPLLAQGRLLGLALAPLALPTTADAPWYSVHHALPSAHRPPRAMPLVVDLASLWAGPLCGHLLQRAGARVVKVESRQRPDGARRGAAAFYALMNQGKASVALDFASPRGIEQLRHLLLAADIVIEGSRPRALRQLGIVTEELLAENPGLTWVSLTGYGRDEPQAQWVAYGDDAGVAAGLSGLMLELAGQPLFVGDAIADPLTGLHAALAAWASHQSGGGRLIALALRDVVGHCLRYTLPGTADGRRARWEEWTDLARRTGLPGDLPPPRRAAAPARPLGADTQAILTELGIRC
ncbi:CoA transferase [Denitratisoma sp. DHT3]|uniref:CoA transferase n=1 Tax=Denitratisoma sp. DHT3 TaxID=1981880 RepID=UPI001C960A67|nr:CoA transferase [Denitratisoma sp. DHT3]